MRTLYIMLNILANHLPTDSFDNILKAFDKANDEEVLDCETQLQMLLVITQDELGTNYVFGKTPQRFSHGFGYQGWRPTQGRQGSYNNQQPSQNITQPQIGYSAPAPQFRQQPRDQNQGQWQHQHQQQQQYQHPQQRQQNNFNEYQRTGHQGQQGYQQGPPRYQQQGGHGQNGNQSFLGQRGQQPLFHQEMNCEPQSGAPGATAGQHNNGDNSNPSPNKVHNNSSEVRLMSNRAIVNLAKRLPGICIKCGGNDGHYAKDCLLYPDPIPESVCKNCGWNHQGECKGKPQ